MYLFVTVGLFLLAIFIAPIVPSLQDKISSPICSWECKNYWDANMCALNNMTLCQALIDQGHPCCITNGEHLHDKICVNKTHSEVQKCLRPTNKEITNKSQCYRSAYEPAGVSEGADCQAFSGKILSTKQVLSEFQCMDLCVRDRRCVGFNIFKTKNKLRPCQLLESASLSSLKECKNDYIGKILDRATFYKAYLNPGCTVQAVT